MSKIKALEYLTVKIRYLRDNFPGLEVQYKHDESIGAHVLKISPEEVYLNNQKYIIEEMKIEEEFEKMFDESILFISENSLNKL